MENLYPWIFFNLFIVFMLAIDLLVFHKKAHLITIKEAIGWTIFWILLALTFNLYIYFEKGNEPALQFLTGYLIEKSLSVDNLFVFLLIFNHFKTPSSSLHKVLFYGVLGAIVFRATFILLGIALITQFYWMMYLFGFFLIITGIRLAFEKEKEYHPDKNLIINLFHKFFPFSKEYVNDKFFIKKNSRYYATPLFVVLLAIESTDIIFAIDSIPAIIAITQDPYIVYTSNIFAILGLRSLYFVLSHMMTLFHYLTYGLSIILIFIGIKMMLSDIYHISIYTSLGIIFGILLSSVILSLIFTKDIEKKK